MQFFRLLFKFNECNYKVLNQADSRAFMPGDLGLHSKFSITHWPLCREIFVNVYVIYDI